MDHEQRLRDLYDAFNRRDVDAILPHLASDVDWPNGWEGGRVRGTDEVRAYWTRQFAAIDPTVTIAALDQRADGRIAATVDQRIRDHEGTTLSEGQITHVYAFDDHDRVIRMDIEE